MIRRRSAGNNLEESILEKLGASLPLWQREWIPEADLGSSHHEDPEVSKVLRRLKRRPGLVLREQRNGGGRLWFLIAYQPTEGPLPTDEDDLADASDQEGDTDFVRGMGIGDSLQALGVEQRKAEPILDGAGTDGCDGATPKVQQDGLPRGETRSQREDLLLALRDARIPVVEIDQRELLGNSVTRYRVLLEGGGRIEMLRRRLEDISRNIGSEVLVSQLPGERFVALDVARPDRQVVLFDSARKVLQDKARNFEVPIPIGITPDGEHVVLDLSILPHLLIAGSPGSGKSVWLLVALMLLSGCLDPKDVELLIIDAKALDFAPFAKLPHVLGGAIITEPEDAFQALQRLIDVELPRRTQLLQEAGCTNLRELRSKHSTPSVKPIVVVIDEFAELVSILEGKERVIFQKKVLRLAQRARAVGIHLIIATQRPSTDFVVGTLKANLPTRISFRLPQRTDSMVILDQPGAERLLGAGDMLLLNEGRVQRLQGYFASTEEISRYVSERIQQLQGEANHV
jgi:hypothetical protein